MKECYQCGKEVHYLFGDSRCGDCTRLSVGQVTGEEPLSSEIEEAFENFLTKYGLEDFEVDEQDDMDILVNEDYKGNRLQLNICYAEDKVAYHLFVGATTTVYIELESTDDVLQFVNKAEEELNKL